MCKIKGQGQGEQDFRIHITLVSVLNLMSVLSSVSSSPCTFFQRWNEPLAVTSLDFLMKELILMPIFSPL